MKTNNFILAILGCLLCTTIHAQKLCFELDELDKKEKVTGLTVNDKYYSMDSIQNSRLVVIDSFSSLITYEIHTKRKILSGIASKWSSYCDDDCTTIRAVKSGRWYTAYQTNCSSRGIIGQLKVRRQEKIGKRNGDM